MSQFMSVEVSAEMVADLMSDDGSFAAEMWLELATRIHAGAMRDDASDIAAGLSKDAAQQLSGAFRSLADAVRDGFNMAHISEQI